MKDVKDTLLTKEADARAQSTIHPHFYYRFVFDRTKNITKARQARRHVILAARYILLLDRFYETGKKQFRESANEAEKQLLKNLSPAHQRKFKNRYKNISSFWAYESSLLDKARFSKRERRTYLRKKSSDVFLYTLVAEFVEPFSVDIVRIFHAAQQLNDMHDDLIDTEEDRKNNSPNIVFLFSWKYESPKDLGAHEREEILGIATDLLHHTEKHSHDLPYIFLRAKRHYQSIQGILKELS